MRFEDNEERERSLVECDSHVGQRDRYEIVDVDASRHEFRFRVRRDEGSNEIGSDGQFCIASSSSALDSSRNEKIANLLW